MEAKTWGRKEKRESFFLKKKERKRGGRWKGALPLH